MDCIVPQPIWTGGYHHGGLASLHSHYFAPYYIPRKRSSFSCSYFSGPYGLPSRLDDDVAFPTDIKLERADDCTPEEDKDLKICVVCGERASGYYFGALVCLPCKSFYIRCTKDGEPTFTCQCNGNCDIAKQGRIRCQYCRYQRCLMAGMCRKEKPETVQPADGQVLCKVCGDIANGIHFGVNTCEGCKKFFRRGLVENQSYLCKSEKKCTINPRNRNNCRYCRYQKCISVGMSREAIKMGRPKKAETTESNNSANAADASESPSISPVPSPPINFSPGSSPSRHQVNDNLFDLSKVKAEPSNCDLTRMSPPSLNSPAADGNLAKPSYADTTQSYAVPYTQSWSSSASHNMDWPQNQRNAHINWHQEIAQSVAQQQMVSSVTTAQTVMSVSNSMPVQSQAVQNTNIVYEEDDMDDILAYLSQDQTPLEPKKNSIQNIAVQSSEQSFTPNAPMQQQQSCMIDTHSSVPSFPVPSSKQFKQQINAFNNQMLQSDSYSPLNVDTSPGHSVCSNRINYPSPTYQYGNGSPNHYSQQSPEHSYGPHSPQCMPPSPQYQQQPSPYSPCQYQNSPLDSNQYHANSPQAASPNYPPSPSNNAYTPLTPYPQNAYAGQGSPSGAMMGEKVMPYLDMKGQMKINQMFMNCDDNIQNFQEDSNSDGFVSRAEFDRNLIIKTLQLHRGNGPEYYSSPESSPHSHHDSSDDSSDAYFTNSCGQKRKSHDTVGMHCESMGGGSFFTGNDKDFQCENYSMMKSQRYWNEPQRLMTQGPPTEEMMAFTNHIMAGYSKFVTTCDEGKKNLQEVLKGQWPAFGKEESHWNHVQRRVIRNITGFMNFVKTIPGFDSINSEDAAELCVMNSFHIAIILSANNYYDKEQKRFQYFWNWTLSPNNPMYFFKLRLLQCGELLNRLNLTPMEETFLSVITFLSTDITNLRDPATLESLRQKMIHIFQAQLIAQGVDPIQRIQELFRVMPDCRHCSMWHKQLMSKMKTNMENQEMHQLFDKLDLENPMS